MSYKTRLLSYGAYQANEIRLLVAPAIIVIGLGFAFGILTVVPIFIVTLFNCDSFSEALISTIFGAGFISFSCSLALEILASRDSYAQTKRRKIVRKRLMGASNVSDEEFLASRSTNQRELLFEVRRRVADRLGVPAKKIPRDINLHDLGIYSNYLSVSVAFEVLDYSPDQDEEVPSHLEQITSIDELTDELAALKEKHRPT